MAFDGLIENFGRNAVKLGQISVQHLAPADDVDAPLSFYMTEGPEKFQA